MTREEFLERLHGRENFGRAVLNKIEIDKDKRRCEFTLVTDAAYTPEDEAFAEKLAREAVPASLAVSVKISKLVADAQLVRHKIVEYLSQNHRAAAAFVTAEDIGVEQSGGTVRFTFGVDEEEKRFFETRGIVEGVAAMLENSFCNKFEGALVYKDKGEIPDETEETDEDDEPLDYRPARTFKIHDFEPIDFADVPKVATYIKDCTFRSTSLTVCGKIEFIQERTSQKGKPYLRFTVSDPTARMSFSYFIKKKTEEKVRALQPGDWIVCTGENEFFNDRLSFTARYVNRGNPPPDFVPEKLPTKAVPAHYKVVAPEKLTDYNQMNLFDRSVIPDCLKENTFVVFDLETTGLVNIPTNGKMDAITEIGAVKIIDGEIRERFTTLVNPERALSEEIVKLTGITDDMVKDAPKIGEVIPDFYKFCDGCFLVGHNVQFDYRFIQYYGAQEDYAFEQKTFDTLSIAQSELFLKNYKLDTIADHYGIVFNHHRACDDALTTAKIFIELIKAKKCLPNA
ncbi:MAG TPA: hypothetical protein H9708_00475 [Candidatus Borkfalkia stercoripullorum]|nr:hypothetical protein [Candidatus Borkfalkia stercoripullorum]